MPDPSEVLQIQARLLQLHQDLEAEASPDRRGSLANAVLNLTDELLEAEGQYHQQVEEAERQAGEDFIKKTTVFTAAVAGAGVVVWLIRVPSLLWLFPTVLTLAAALFARYVEPHEGRDGQPLRRLGTGFLAVGGVVSFGLQLADQFTHVPGWSPLCQVVFLGGAVVAWLMGVGLISTGQPDEHADQDWR